MKKTEMINADISRVIATLGHTDEITVGDCGLPIPEGVERIDLAYQVGKPGFLDVLKAVASEQYIEKVVLASEIKDQNPQMLEKIIEFISAVEDEQENAIAIEFISHKAFKKQTSDSKAVIRTGENTPYANIILSSGVVF